MENVVSFVFLEFELALLDDELGFLDDDVLVGDVDLVRDEVDCFGDVADFQAFALLGEVSVVCVGVSDDFSGFGVVIAGLKGKEASIGKVLEEVAASLGASANAFFQLLLSEQ